jgi:hypothetical protein
VRSGLRKPASVSISNPSAPAPEDHADLFDHLRHSGAHPSFVLIISVAPPV